MFACVRLWLFICLSNEQIELTEQEQEAVDAATLLYDSTPQLQELTEKGTVGEVREEQQGQRCVVKSLRRSRFVAKFRLRQRHNVAAESLTSSDGSGRRREATKLFVALLSRALLAPFCRRKIMSS